MRSERVDLLMKRAYAFELRTGIKVTGITGLEYEFDDAETREAKLIYRNAVNKAHAHHSEVTAPAKAEYDAAFADALENLLIFFEAQCPA